MAGSAGGTEGHRQGQSSVGSAGGRAGPGWAILPLPGAPEQGGNAGVTITDLWGRRSGHHSSGTQEWPPQLRDTAVTRRGAGPSCGAVGLGCGTAHPNHGIAHPKLGIAHPKLETAHPNHGTAHPSPPHPPCWDMCPGLGVTTCRVSGCPGRALRSLSGCHHYFPGNIPTLSFSPPPQPQELRPEGPWALPADP